MSYVVDAWSQPGEPSFFEAAPEIKRLFKQSKSPIDAIYAMKDRPTGTKELLDKAGVTKTLLSAWSGHKVGAITNEKVLEYVTAFPDRFVGVGAVDLLHPAQAVKDVEKCVKEYGFKGIRILPWLWNLPPTTNYYYPVFAKCVELDVPFCTQVGHTGPLMPSEPGRPVPYIDQVALDFPELKIVCGHIGYPWTDEMIGVAWKHPNVYIDTSAHAPRYYPQQLLHFMSSYGKDKVLFGVNYPQLSWEICVKQAKELPLKPAIMEKFLWRNANHVFKLGMDDSKTADSKL